MRALKILPILLLFMCGCTARKFSVRSDDMTNWHLVKRQVCKSESQMKKVFGPSCQMFIGYQVKKVVIQTLRTEDYKEMKVEIFITSDEANARNMYARYQTITKAPVGNDGSSSPGFVSFYRNNNFVRITAQRNLTGKDNYLLEVAKIIDKKLMQ